MPLKEVTIINQRRFCSSATPTQIPFIYQHRETYSHFGSILDLWQSCFRDRKPQRREQYKCSKRTTPPNHLHSHIIHALTTSSKMFNIPQASFTNGSRLIVNQTLTTIIENIPPTFATTPLERWNVSTHKVDDVNSILTINDKEGNACIVSWCWRELISRSMEYLSPSRLKVVHTVKGDAKYEALLPAVPFDFE